MNRIFKHLKYPVRYPGIVPRAAWNYVSMFVLRRPRLRGIEFALNYTCQCECDHCSAAFLEDRSRSFMPLDRMKRALEDMWRLGSMNINFTGGEALLHPDLEALVGAAHPRSTMVSVATNGLLLDAAKARELRRWGVRIVTFSIDSAHRERHDAGRKRAGCFDAVIDATRYCREAGIEPFWCTIMTKENATDGDLLALVEMATAKDLTLTINRPCHVGGWWDQEVTLSEEAARLHADLMRRPNLRWEGHSNYREEGCPAGLEKLYISPYGDVMPCPFIHISYGNLVEKDLPEIWRTLLAEGPFNEIRDGCPISSDQAFADRYIKPIYDGEEHPLPHEKLRATEDGGR